MDQEKVFDLEKFKFSQLEALSQYDRQLERLRLGRKEITSIETAVRGAVKNLERGARSFVIYGEPQSGKTEMMICLTGKLIDMGQQLIIHLLNDSVDLLTQNLGRFKESGLSPAARNFSEILDPAVKMKGNAYIVFCKKNGSDLRKLIEKISGIEPVVVIDDEADYASPNSKVNRPGERTPINDLIHQILNKSGIYIGVTATPARLDLNNTFDNDSKYWVDFPAHSHYTGQDIFFPMESQPKYQRTLLPDAGDDPKYSRQALFGFLVNAAHLNITVLERERNFSFLIHTSGKKIDHKSDWGVIHSTLTALADEKSAEFARYVEAIWFLARSRYPEADTDEITRYILRNISRHALVVLNSERDWKDNSSAATNPQSLFTIIIGGNIVSRGVTLNNLLSMFFTRDVKHKIQQDTYIQRARMFGARGEYLAFFELTIPQALYLDWHRCFVFHKLALSAIREGLGSLVWIGDSRISPVSSSSINRGTVDLDRGEMAFPIFDLTDKIISISSGTDESLARLRALAEIIEDTNLPQYLIRFIERTSAGQYGLVALHPPMNITGYTDANHEQISRAKGFIGNTQLNKSPTAVHHVFLARNNQGKARIIYKYRGNIQFIKNMTNDP
ncbi:hypothetical protein OCJ37_18395 [Xanthomonas sp. AM6]|uniref:Z1 domain-containing protein n=1 Tax=Xanthomonas sp. AM6 TaxID=2982531 RepID=UPI0021D7D6CA|nr:Z1 domain-containing protein [Xanthomonas sp. AM6]UYB51917.1 hypothetical protein OCJ37_18395 [Xanthomonas sp. AM6]